jgi:hypothetical protein
MSADEAKRLLHVRTPGLVDLIVSRRLVVVKEGTEKLISRESVEAVLRETAAAPRWRKAIRRLRWMSYLP